MKIQLANNCLKNPAFKANITFDQGVVFKDPRERRPEIPEIGKVYHDCREIIDMLDMQNYLTPKEEKNFIKQAAAIGTPSDQIRVKVYELSGNYRDYNRPYFTFYPVDFVTYINGKPDNLRLTTAMAKVEPVHDSINLYDHRLISMGSLYDSIPLLEYKFNSISGEFALPQLVKRGLEIIKKRVLEGKYK